MKKPEAELAKQHDYKKVGISEERVDGPMLVTGRGGFTDDVDMRGMLSIKVLRSPHAHAKITSIDVSAAREMDGVHEVLTHENVPRIQFTRAGQNWPEPSPDDMFMFDRKVRYVGDRVAAVAAESPELAEEALENIDVEYEELPAVFDPEEALEPDAPKLHEGEEPKGIADFDRNLSSEVGVEVGDVEQGFEEADVVVENEYSVTKPQHTPIEPHIAIGWMDEEGRLNLRTSTQVPYHCRRIIAPLLELDIKDIRVNKPRIGGGFGGKQSAVIEDIVGMMALRTDRPCKLLLDREEEFSTTSSRHPYVIRMKTGVNEDGTIVANQMECVSNTGAHGTHGMTVSLVTGGKCFPLYRAENLRFHSNIAYTNLPPSGAFRGYGAPQGYFPLESHMDDVAREIDMDVVEFRAMNHLREGEDNPLSRPLGEGGEGPVQHVYTSGLPECIEQGTDAIDWERYAGVNKDEGRVKRGVGMAILMQASGIPAFDMGAAWMKMNEDGSFNIHYGATDLGTGADTVLAQIAAETLNITPDDIVVYSADTDHTPYDTGAYASSTTYISGGAVKNAAEDIKEQILERASHMTGVPTHSLELGEKKVISRGTDEELTYSEICHNALYMDPQRQIQATGSHMSYDSAPPFAAHFAQVAVDTETGEIDVEKYVAATDCGIQINPQGCEGQVEGAIAQSLGYALTEEWVIDEDGAMVNSNFTDYKIQSSRDMPELENLFVETHDPTGPYGAKAVAEIPMNGPAPAVANAIYDAVGVRIKDLPMTPEKVLMGLKEQQPDEVSAQPTPSPVAT